MGQKWEMNGKRSRYKISHGGQFSVRSSLGRNRRLLGNFAPLKYTIICMGCAVDRHRGVRVARTPGLRAL